MYKENWCRQRIDYVTKHYGHILQHCTSLINMAANQGDLSALLVEQFPNIVDVTNEEGRQKHIDLGKETYAH